MGGGFSWRVRWKDSKLGKWRSLSGGRSKDEARIIEAQVRQSLLQGVDPSSQEKVLDDWTMTQVIESFYNHSRFLGGTERWKKEVHKKITNDIEPYFGKMRFGELSSEHLNRFYVSIKKRGLAHSTIEKYHHLLRIMGDVYAEIGGDRVNPIRRLRDFSKRFPKQAPSRDINFLTPGELEKLFVETKKSHRPLLAEFTCFLAHTGLRRTEALELKWTDIDENANLLHVRKSKSGRSRIVPLETEAMAAIAGLKGNGLHVFSKFDGSRYYPDSFLRPLQRAAKRAGILKRIDIHTLRHSFGSNKIRMGWGIKKVSVLLGHADISTTAKIYAHLLDGDLRIRDDARMTFDKSENSKDIESTGNAETTMAQIIANTITSSLAGTHNADQALSWLLRSFSELAKVVQSQDSASSAEIQGDLEADSKNGRYAPLMLHAGLVNENSGLAAAGSKPELSLLFQELAPVENVEPMIRIERTTYALRTTFS